MIAVTKSAVGWLEAPPASQIVVRSPVTGFIVANPTLPWPNLGQKVERDSSLANVNIFLTSQEISQLVIAKDGYPLSSPYQADTVLVAPGERYTVLVSPTAEQQGVWAFHCHILSHAEKEDGMMFGMFTAFIVKSPT